VKGQRGRGRHRGRWKIICAPTALEGGGEEPVPLGPLSEQVGPSNTGPGSDRPPPQGSSLATPALRRTPSPCPGLAFAVVKPGLLGLSWDDLCSAQHHRLLLLCLLLLSSEQRRLPRYQRVICIPTARVCLCMCGERPRRRCLLDYRAPGAVTATAKSKRGRKKQDHL
jgi:hypothetical protein